LIRENFHENKGNFCVFIPHIFISTIFAEIKLTPSSTVVTINRFANYFAGKKPKGSELFLTG
jgi:hypothetical protein